MITIFDMLYLILSLVYLGTFSSGENSSQSLQKDSHRLRNFVFASNCDYGGFDIFNQRNISTVRKCIGQCYETPRCTHATYNHTNQVCYLKEADTKRQVLETRRASDNTWCIFYDGEDRYEAAAATTTIQLEIMSARDALSKNFVINKKCDYRDSDISNVQNVLSARECAAQCNKTLRCTHAAYNGKNKKCYLKHANSKEQIQQTRFDRNNAWCIYYNGEDRFEAAVRTTTVQPKNTTTQDTVPKNFVINKKCDYRDSDISNLENILSARECAAECNKTTRCTHAAFYGRNKKCFLKHANSKEQIQQTRFDRSNAWCIYYDGEDRFEAAVTTTTVQTKGTTTTVQPESTTTEDPVPKYFTFNESCGYRGHDISILENFTGLVECAAQCYELPNCTHATYHSKKPKCYLKHANSTEQIEQRRIVWKNAWCILYNGEDRFQAVAGTTTIQPLMTTTEDTVSKHFVINESCDYRGSDISNLQNVSSAGECVAQCYKNLNCTHITYNGNNKICFLKHADSKQKILEKRYDSFNAWCAYYNREDRFGAAAATTTIQPEITTTQDTASKNFSIYEKCGYRGSDMSKFENISSADGCAAQCLKTLRCTHATYVIKNKKCYLKHANSKELIQKTRYDYNNGTCILYNGEDRFEAAVAITTIRPKTTTVESSVSKNFVVNENCDYFGNNLSIFQATSVGECTAQCNATWNCTHLTYNGYNKICFLKRGLSKQKILENQTPAEYTWCAYYKGDDRASRQ